MISLSSKNSYYFISFKNYVLWYFFYDLEFYFRIWDLWFGSANYLGCFRNFI